MTAFNQIHTATHDYIDGLITIPNTANNLALAYLVIASSLADNLNTPVLRGFLYQVDANEKRSRPYPIISGQSTIRLDMSACTSFLFTPSNRLIDEYTISLYINTASQSGVNGNNASIDVSGYVTDLGNTLSILSMDLSDTNTDVFLFGSRLGVVEAIQALPPVAPSWDFIAGKPTSFNPSAHAHDISDVTGLGIELSRLDSRIDVLEVAPIPVSGRERLTANRTYHVRTDGGDSNNGLTNTSDGAFLTIQKAIDVVSTLDGNGYTATILFQTSTIATPIVLKSLLGFERVIIDGGGAILSNSAGINFFEGEFSGIYLLKDFTLNFNNGSGVAHSGGTIEIEGLNFAGTTTGVHIFPGGQAARVKLKAYTISGNAYAHYFAYFNAVIDRFNAAVATTVTLTGIRDFSIFAFASRGGIIDMNSSGGSFVFSGSATGQRYKADASGILYCPTSGGNYFPGSIQGALETGGQYI